MAVHKLLDIDALLTSRREELDRQRRELNRLGYGKRRLPLHKNTGKKSSVPISLTNTRDWRSEESATNAALLKEIQDLKRKNRSMELENDRLNSKVDIGSETIECLQQKIKQISEQSHSYQQQVSKLTSLNRDLRQDMKSLKIQLGKSMADLTSMHAQYQGLLKTIGTNDSTEGNNNDNNNNDSKEEGGGDEIDGDSEMDTTDLLNLDLHDASDLKSAYRVKYAELPNDMDLEMPIAP